jgi:AcrR family transcriptional regulator
MRTTVTGRLGFDRSSALGCGIAAHPEQPLREVRERELVKATRALFDERGAQEAPIEEIARNVGIARGLVYRQFSSKEELYVLTVTDYLAELEGVLREAIASAAEPRAQLEATSRAYAGFLLRYPAFLDASLSLMRGPAIELHDKVSESVWLRLGDGMIACIGQLEDVLHALGHEDAHYLANVLWTQCLGLMHLGRIGIGLRRGGSGPEMFEVDDATLVDSCVRAALAQAG